MTVPLCKTRCDAGQCMQEKLVYGEFGVLGNHIEPRRDGSDNEITCDYVATVFVPLYNSLVGANIPQCDDLNYGVLEAGFYSMFQLLVATDDRSSDVFDIPYEIPQHVQDTARSHGTEVFGAIYVLPMPLTPYIEWQCSEME
ncbi:hypothetical protein FGB62_191g01 [Gracilaria domingensis]|nr:hypothetical protein FGB62_191g01 [Gracilaria domingensis]